MEGETTADCLGTDTLVDYVEGRAGVELRMRVEEHASRCASCREVLSSLAREGTPVAPGAEPPRPLGLIEPGTRVGRYVIARKIGAGGVGMVYAAHDPELGRLVAVKLLRADRDARLHERLRREAQAMAQLAHPNVVAVYDVGVFDERVFIAMEHVAGETLARWLAEPRSQREILDVYRAAGRGLTAAHAAGIVHRDFKPENVLIGDDGRVRVGDFGLARTAGDRVDALGTPVAFGSAVTASDGGPLTAPGTLLGTPFYIAPELYGGADADRRSDQFSYCVALFTALHGERPFHGETAEEFAANVRAGQLREPPAGRRVPRRIRAALRRGLNVDPAMRFASLDDLLVELSDSPRRWAAWALGTAVVAAATTWLMMRPANQIPDQRCTGAAAAFAAAWNPARRAEIQAAFTASRMTYAPAALTRVTDLLDRYAARWVRAHTEACRATRILGEQTEAMLDLRMTCLGRRLQDAAALVTALSKADRSIVVRSVEAVSRLPDIAGCADLSALRQAVPPPADPIARAKLSELTPRLAEARAAGEVGAYSRALEVLQPLAAAARALGYLPFQAEAEWLQGRIEYEKNDLTSAENTLMATVWSAEAGRNDEIAGRAWVMLLFVVGYSKAEQDRAVLLVPRATAALARLGGKAELEQALEGALGSIDSLNGRYDSAIGHFEKSVAAAERAFEADDFRLALPLVNLATVFSNRGDAHRAIPILQRALGIQERALGPDHPHTARTLAILALAHGHLGDFTLAEQELRRTITIREAALGPRHPELGTSFDFLADVLGDQGRSAEAVALQRRAVAIGETGYGPEHPRFGQQLRELARHLGRVGHYAEAREHLRRAESILTKFHGPDHAEVMRVLVVRGELAFWQSRWREAAALLERAIPVLEKVEFTRGELTNAVVLLGLACLELHQPARGLPHLGRLAPRLKDVRADLRVAAEFALARALWESRGDRERAQDLATRALAEIKQLPAAGRGLVRAVQIERWLASHEQR
jgi:eukaryotic-like serine/threonine-protein kinase